MHFEEIMSKTRYIEKGFTIRNSCITGRAVWLHFGHSSEAARKAYWRACRKEVERIRNWTETAARRKANILGLLSALTANLPVGEELPPEKKAAARRLVAIAEKAVCDRGFYDHIMEERRRRQQRRKN